MKKVNHSNRTTNGNFRLCADRSADRSDARKRLRSSVRPPKTQIEIEIKANKVNYKPGEFSKYADRYLRLTNVSAEPEEYWELNSVKVKPVGVPKQRSYLFRQTERQNRSSSYGTD